MSKFILSLLLVMTLATPRPAEAAVGLSYGSFGASLIGIGILGAGGAAVYGGIKVINQGSAGKIILGIALFGFALGAGWLGLLILDGQEKASPEFSPLSSPEAKALGVSEEQREVYNSELDQLNAVNIEIVSQIQGEKHEIGVKKASVLWNEYKDTLDQRTFEVLLKIAAQVQ